MNTRMAGNAQDVEKPVCCAVLLNGQPVLEFYDVHQTTKWGALGYESLFFVFFFLAAWTVSLVLPSSLS